MDCGRAWQCPVSRIGDDSADMVISTRPGVDVRTVAFAKRGHRIWPDRLSKPQFGKRRLKGAMRLRRPPQATLKQTLI
jgi:hypothetical protein